MKNMTNVSRNLTLIIIFMLMLVSCNQGPSDVTQEIQSANDELMAAVSLGNPAALTAFYTDDAKIFPSNNEIVDGKQAIEGFWGWVINHGIKKVRFETTLAQKFGNIAIEEGKFALLVEGDIVVDQGKYIVTWKKEDGKWKVFRDIWNVNTPFPTQRAVANDNVLIVLNHVKADKVAQFEDFNINILNPAAAEFYPKVKSTVRMQKPVGQNADGTFTYIYFMDPFVSTYDYAIETSLKAKYGEEKTAEYMKMYLDCLKDGKSEVFFAVETGW
jgi:ketosteroid isomerase-like protein